MVLLVSAGLFAKSEERTLRADPGYRPDKVVVTQLRFPENTSLAAARVRLDAVAARMRGLPGVHAVAFSDEMPLREGPRHWGQSSAPAVEAAAKRSNAARSRISLAIIIGRL